MSLLAKVNQRALDIGVKTNHKQRLGQELMNALFEIRPDLYKEITGSDIDPFYRDDRINKFELWLSTK